jgi:hypothetical protein
MTMTYDYTRHRSITLFAALIAATGKLITRTEARHTHVEWLRFLRQIDRETRNEVDPHLIADTYATHKDPKMRARLARHLRFRMQLTPTSSSWRNLVERFLADLPAHVIPLGQFRLVGELIADIRAHLARRNETPKPYKWRAIGEAILKNVRRARAALDNAAA